MAGTNVNIAKEIREAIRAGDMKRVQGLIGDDDQRLKIVTPFGTWLHQAASFGQPGIVEYLVEKGADVNAYAGIEGAARLHAAASEGHLDIVRYLLGHGAKLDVSAPEKNPLFGAIYGGHGDVAKALVDAGIDVNVKYTGETMKNMDALTFARERGQPEIAKMLEGVGGKDMGARHTGRRKSDDEADAGAVQSAEDDVARHMKRHFGRVEPLAVSEIVPVTGIKIHAIRGRGAASRWCSSQRA